MVLVDFKGHGAFTYSSRTLPVRVCLAVSFSLFCFVCLSFSPLFLSSFPFALFPIFIHRRPSVPSIIRSVCLFFYLSVCDRFCSLVLPTFSVCTYSLPPPVHLKNDQRVVYPMWTDPTHSSTCQSCLFFFVIICPVCFCLFFSCTPGVLFSIQRLRSESNTIEERETNAYISSPFMDNKIVGSC